MYELIEVAPCTCYFDCPAKVGLYRLSDSEVCLIDSGSDKDAARKILRCLTANGWTLRAIYNTHSHADHVGGSAFLSARTGCNVYAPEADLSFTRQPEFEPALLYGGCPPQALRSKFLMAQPSDAKPLRPDALPEGLTFIAADGHCPAMAAFRTEDGVWFLGDCVSSAAILDKYAVTYLYDVAQYLDTLERVSALEGQCFIPAHAPVLEQIAPLAAVNRAKVEEILELTVQLTRGGVRFDELLKGVFDHYGLSMDFNQYALVGSTMRGYLSYLLDRQRLRTEFRDNWLYWHSV